ncbi:hypothetical protein [Rhodoplanes sp. SY1]|uniref:hypothetical protein n=1 Tax=Rhodoplanes sp. SY1 TaxID=3166646 RepID=UPI0038B4F50F
MVSIIDDATAPPTPPLLCPSGRDGVEWPGAVELTCGARGAVSPGAGELPRGRGRRLPETLAALAARDDLIRTAREKFWPDATEREAATQIAAGIARYAASAWVRERLADQVPTRHAGRPAAIWWKVLSIRDHVPSPETVRRALRRGVFVNRRALHSYDQLNDVETSK